MVQPLKDGLTRPSYKPAARVHEVGLIVARHLEPSNERAALKPMLDRHAAAFGANPSCVLLDAGFSSLALPALTVESNIDVLCPTGRAVGADGWERRAGYRGRFPKQAFHYIADRDRYRCPGGRELVYEERRVDKFGRRYRVCRGAQCAHCVLRERCTESKYGRLLKRYEGEELKEATAQVLSRPAARAKYQRRKTIVEPCFAELRERQGLKRFRRRGLVPVRVEFALHCIAFNLKKALRGAFLIWLTLSLRTAVSPCRALGPFATCFAAC